MMTPGTANLWRPDHNTARIGHGFSHPTWAIPALIKLDLAVRTTPVSGSNALLIPTLRAFDDGVSPILLSMPTEPSVV